MSGSTAGSSWTRGRRLGIDVGTARIGIACCDPDGILATPVETIRVQKASSDSWVAEVRRVLELIEEYQAVGVIIGLPTSLANKDTASTHMARSFADALGESLRRLPMAPDLELCDERLTTVTASAALHGAGRNTRSQREIIDQAAAVVLLQSWIDSRRAQL